MGRPKKKVSKHGEEKGQEREERLEVLVEAPPVSRPVVRHEDLREKPELSYAEHIVESRKALDHPLQPGQKFFESPEGEIIIGEADKGHVWSRRANNGQGGFVNPKR